MNNFKGLVLEQGTQIDYQECIILLNSGTIDDIS
jgi:hypothetical protein